ncbi:MAG: hypothetical protein IIX27_03685 [Ruminococcus sp.]|nr:hypothetical protein [Ruminococcus sp.]
MDNNYISRTEHNEYVRRMEDEHKRLNNRILMLEKTSAQMHELVKNVGIMATNMKHMAKLQNDLNERLERLEQVPSNNFNVIKNSVFAAIGAALGGAIVSAMLMFL